MRVYKVVASVFALGIIVYGLVIIDNLADKSKTNEDGLLEASSQIEALRTQVKSLGEKPVIGPNDTPTPVGDPDDPEFQDPEFQDPEIQNPEIQNPENQESELQNPESNDEETQESELDNPEVQDSEFNDPEIQDEEIQEPEEQEPENQEPENQEEEIQDKDHIESFTFEWMGMTWTCTDSDNDDHYTCEAA